MGDEEKLARLLWDRLRLDSLPVDVAGIARNYCDVEWDDVPFVDAVLVGKTRRERPLIVLANCKPRRRERFTLAHELGHALIPWHLGVMTCHTDWRNPDPEEVEANRFASELLLPRAYVEQQSLERSLPRRSRDVHGISVRSSASPQQLPGC